MSLYTDNFIVLEQYTERVSVVLGGFRTPVDGIGLVPDIGWQYPPAQLSDTGG